MAQTTDSLLTMAQTVEALNTSRATLYRWLREGRIQGHKTGRQWRFKKEEVERFFKGSEPAIDLPADIRPLLNSLQSGLAESWESTGEKLEDAFVLMIRTCIERAADSLHLAHHQVPGESGKNAWIRVRIDGNLQTLSAFDHRLLQPILNHWKKKAQCDARCNDLPQDGLIILESDGVLHELSCSFLPTNPGESLTVKISNLSKAQPRLRELQLSQREYERLKTGLKKRSRLLVVSGPAGSSVEHTLAACLREIASAELKVMTIDHPSLRSIPWSLPLNRRHLGGNRNYSAAIRTLLRSEPDVLGLHTIPDPDTATAIQEAVLSGLLVLAGLRADSASQALLRLSQLFEPGNQIGQVLELVVTQRAVRVLCENCKVKSRLTATHQTQLEMWMRAGGLTPDKTTDCFQSRGCMECGGSGYRGRRFVREILSLTPAILRALKNKELENIEALAVEDGMITLDAQSLGLVQQGLTSLEEAGRFLPYFD